MNGDSKQAPVVSGLVVNDVALLGVGDTGEVDATGMDAVVNVVAICGEDVAGASAAGSTAAILGVEAAGVNAFWIVFAGCERDVAVECDVESVVAVVGIVAADVDIIWSVLAVSGGDDNDGVGCACLAEHVTGSRAPAGHHRNGG